MTIPKQTLDDTQIYHIPSTTSALYVTNLLLASGLLSGFGDFSGLLTLLDTLDDTDGDSLTHVADGETTERRIVGEGFDAHWFGGNHLDNCSITRLDEFG